MSFVIWLILTVLLLPWDMLEPWSATLPEPGVQTAPFAPVQVDFQPPQPLGPIGGEELFALASYELEARVLSRRRYWFDWAPAWFGTSASPIDLTVGWGPMSDSAMTERVTFQNFLRIAFAYSDLPIFQPDTKSQFANMHMIPATGEVRDTLLDVRTNQTVRMKGYLVELRHDGELIIRSSMSRYDGDNLRDCEIMYVTEIEVIPIPNALAATSL
ncbi:MAG: hypothetical protein AAF556_04220 [Pseudomonadota bacterium]